MGLQSAIFVTIPQHYREIPLPLMAGQKLSNGFWMGGSTLSQIISIIGIGLEGASGLSPKSLTLIQQATVLVGGDRHLGYFPEHRAERLVLGKISESLTIIQQRLEQGHGIVVLASGDPLFYGIGRLFLEYFPPEVLRFYPHLSAVQLAFNRLKRPWQDATIISVHGRSLELLTAPLQKGQSPLAILTDPTNHPPAIARFCQSLDLPSHYQAWLCQDLGGETEMIESYALDALAQVKPEAIAALNLLVLERCDTSSELDLASLPILGVPDHCFLSFADRPGLMTKREVRLLALGEMALQPGQVIWDIGAGTGSMAIEMARLCPTSRIYAIEKTAMGISLIQQNCQRFGLTNIQAIPAQAPLGLASLPQPDRIFVGGSGGKLEEILHQCQSRLTAQGKLVIALATLENFSRSLQWFEHQGWSYTVQQAQISRSHPIAGLTRLQPLNPVYILSAQK